MKHIKLFEDFTELSRGDKAALTRGDELTSKDQAAVVYCIAKGWVKEIGLNDTPAETWYQACGLNQVTFDRSVRKMKNMLKDIVTSSEVEFPKIRKYFEDFGGKTDSKKAEATDLAANCVEKDHGNKAQANGKPKKLNDINLYKEVNDTTNGLIKSLKMTPETARKKAITRVAKTHSVPEASLEKLFLTK